MMTLKISIFLIWLIINGQCFQVTGRRGFIPKNLLLWWERQTDFCFLVFARDDGSYLFFLLFRCLNRTDKWICIIKGSQVGQGRVFLSAPSMEFISIEFGPLFHLKKAFWINNDGHLYPHRNEFGNLSCIENTRKYDF